MQDRIRYTLVCALENIKVAVAEAVLEIYLRIFLSRFVFSRLENATFHIVSTDTPLLPLQGTCLICRWQYLLIPMKEIGLGEGMEWLGAECKSFFETRADYQNPQYDEKTKRSIVLKNRILTPVRLIQAKFRGLKRKLGR